MNRCPGEEALSAYLDGEATAEERAHVAACGACREAVRRLREPGARLRALPLAREAAPASLRARLERLAAKPARAPAEAAPPWVPAAPLAPVAVAPAPLHLPGKAPAPPGAFGATGSGFRRRPRLPRPLRWALAGVPAAAAVAAAFVLTLGGGVSPALAAEAAAVHRLAAGGACEWTDSPEHLRGRLAAVLGHDVDLPLPPDAELLGATPCTLFGERAVAVSYRARGEEITLLLPPAEGAAADACSKRSRRSCRTVDGQTVCVVPDAGGRPRIVVGALPADELCATVEST